MEQTSNSSKRVGTVTMAISLILVGSLMIVDTFSEALTIELISRLAPSILIILGVEILIRYFTSKGDTLKYDFLSGVVCFCLIVGSFILANIPQIISLI